MGAVNIINGTVPVLEMAAYLLDRADQYETKSASWIGLVDAATALANGEVHAAIAHGELDDEELVRRVRAMVRP